MKFALVDIRINPECEVSLKALGYDIIKLPPFSRLPTPLASHPDMLLHKCEDCLITSRAYYEENKAIFNRLEEEGEIRLAISDECPTDKYPFDAIFNALPIENGVLLRRSSASRDIIKHYEKGARSIINTNQGYPACTALYLGANHIITSDSGIKRSAENYGIRVTLIENGDISLPPYEYGFIGGASGVDEKTVFFFGDIKSHRSYEKIANAINECGLSYISLGAFGLVDLGGIVFIPKKSKHH